MNVLVTGGAGYIGSHVVRLLIEAGHKVVSVDDLSTGIADRLSCESVDMLLEAEESAEKLTKLLMEREIEVVIHLAARKQVGESFNKPEFYFHSNVGGLANLLTAMRNAGVCKLVFSSSAAVYGMPEVEAVDETSPTEPINPYGQTKLIGEWMISNASSWGLSAISLRYFNVAGSGWHDLADKQALNLIPIIFDRIQTGQSVEVFGDDYPTEDGSCIRDYIHVLDLARAHVSAIAEIGLPEHRVFNVGTGNGSSVFEVIAEIKKISGLDFEVQISPRRPGDPPRLIAAPDKILNELDWKPTFNLSEIVSSAWESRGF